MANTARSDFVRPLAQDLISEKPIPLGFPIPIRTARFEGMQP